MIATTIIVVVIIILFAIRRVKPVPGGEVSSGYGYRTHPVQGGTHFHNGLDISAPSGTPIKNLQFGEVVATGYDSLNGNYVKIKHANYSTFFGHMLEPARVQKGQKLLKGHIVGYIGSTGMSTGPHTHFIVYDKNGNTVDPAKQTFYKV